MTFGVIRSTSRSISASTFRALIRSAEQAPRSSLVFPVIRRPSGSSRAAAVSPVSSARFSAASTTFLSFVVIPALFIRSSIL